MAKHSIKFLGHNASGFVRYGGVTFPCGKTVSVDDEEFNDPTTLGRLEGSPEFSVHASNHPPKPGPKPVGGTEKD